MCVYLPFIDWFSSIFRYYFWYNYYYQFLKSIHKIIKVKVHLHYSHVTGRNFGYAYDFCNWRICENKCEIPMIAHNLFGFDMFFLWKVIDPLLGVQRR